MPSLKDELAKLSKPQRPRTKMQKQYANYYEYKGRMIAHFPSRVHLEILREIRRGHGVKPKAEYLKMYKEIWRLTKSPLGYSCVEDFVELSGIPHEAVSQHLTWLVKNARAIAEVDRWGRPTYIWLEK